MSFRKRWFLEPPSTDVDSYVVVYDYMEGRARTRWDSITLKIADCDRNVKLEFPVGDAKQRSRSRRKLQRLRKALDLLEERIEL